LGVGHANLVEYALGGSAKIPEKELSPKTTCFSPVPD
jgi:hypothetical protein